MCLEPVAALVMGHMTCKPTYAWHVSTLWHHIKLPLRHRPQQVDGSHAPRYNTLDAAVQTRQCSAVGVVDRLSGGHSVAAQVGVMASPMRDDTGGPLVSGQGRLLRRVCCMLYVVCPLFWASTHSRAGKRPVQNVASRNASLAMQCAPPSLSRGISGSSWQNFPVSHRQSWLSLTLVFCV